MPVSQKHKCIFIHIPKNGGVSVENALDIFGDDELEDREKMYGQIKSGDLLNHRFPSPVLQHLRILDLRKIISEKNFNEFFKFAFVRNPWDRMVSLYHFNIPFIQKLEGVDREIPSFKDFLFNELNPFLRLEQYQFLSDDNGKIIMDFVGRFENINNDFRELCGKLGIPAVNLPHKNRINHKHYSEYYTEETKQFVAALFKNDIEIFGYKFEMSGWHKIKKQSAFYYRKNISEAPEFLFNKIKTILGKL